MIAHMKDNYTKKIGKEYFAGRWETEGYFNCCTLSFIAMMFDQPPAWFVTIDINNEFIQRRQMMSNRLKINNRIKYCSEASCSVKFIYLLNPKTLKYVPVDYNTLTSDEKNAIEGNVSVMIVPVSRDDDMKKVSMVMCYNPAHHVSHFKTCTKPNLFSSSKKKEG